MARRGRRGRARQGGKGLGRNALPTTKPGKGKGRKARDPLRVPAGYYDPALDASLRAAKRGYRNLKWDVGLGPKGQIIGGQSQRNLQDLLIGASENKRAQTELGEDVTRQRGGIEQGYSRNLSDLLTERTQGQEDYTRNLAQLQRNYNILGNQQAQAQRAAGVQAGGAVAQAQRKRTANQAWERQPIDVAQSRFMQRSMGAQGRLAQDRQTSLSDLLRSERRGTGQIQRAAGEQALGYTRGAEDLTKSFTRAGRELEAFKLDTGEAKTAQAAQFGWPPPKIKAPKAKGQKRRRRR